MRLVVNSVSNNNGPKDAAHLRLFTVLSVSSYTASTSRALYLQPFPSLASLTNSSAHADVFDDHTLETVC